MRYAITPRLLAALTLLLMFFVFAACDTRVNTYHSIWEDVYGYYPAYQDELEEMKVD